MNEQLHHFYLQQEEPNKSSLLALRSIILNEAKEMTETQKYGMPCFCYGKKIICYLWTDKKTGEPYILFTDGKLLDFPELEAGDRSRMKIFRINPRKDLPVKRIHTIFRKALNL